MRNSRGLGRLSGATILVSSVLIGVLQSPAMAQEEQLVVTGSYIKRKDAFDQASPISVLDSVDIAAQGTPHMGDIVKNQTFNYGTDYVAVATASTFQEGSRSFANFRGLGEAATLTLVDGRRAGTGNVNILYPQLAIARIESLKDGASALYGSDAVAGVINIIPKKDFEGFQLQAYHLLPDDSQGDYDESQWSMILGAGDEQTHVVGAFEYRERGRLRWIDRPLYNNRQFSTSATSQPGVWSVPQRTLDVNGAPQVNAARLTLADPGCGVANGPGGTDKNRTGAFSSGIPGAPAANGRVGSCSLDYAQFWDFVIPLEGFTGWASATHDFNDYLTFEAQFSFARHQAFGRGSPSNPGGRFGELGAIPGTHPGNPFRAFIDPNGNGRVDAGEQLLYAQDANNDGIPDRSAANVVLLAANPFAPRAADPNNPSVAPDAANGGIAFNEDVLANSFRAFGKQGTLPSRHNSDGSGEGSTSSTEVDFRWTGGIKVAIPDTTWTGEVFYTYEQNNPSFPENQAESFSAIADGIAGRLGPANNQFYNPFSTAAHPCVNRVCNGSLNTPSTSAAFNSQYVADEVSFRDDIDVYNTFNFVDIVATGDVADLWAGTLSVAVGAQWRRGEFITDQGPIADACDRWVNQCGFDFDESRTTHAVFGELALPLFDTDMFGTMDLQAAIRYEDSGSGLNSTDPKVALRWQPRDWVALRGSYGTSFIAPGLGQMFAVSTSFLENMLDSTCQVTGSCGVAGAFRTQTFSGNPGLLPEEADVYNLGFSLSLLEDDLTLSADFVNFDFTDRISRLRGQDVIDADVVRFRQFLATNGCSAPTGACGATLREQWIDPTNKATGNFEDPNIKRTITGVISEVLTKWVNAQTMKWEGIDVSVGYRWDAQDMPYIGGDYGSFRVSTDFTYVTTYEYTLTGAPAETCQGSARRPPCEGAGHRNDRTSVVPPIPRWRANAQLSWFMGQHNASLIGRYTHHVIDDSAFVSAATIAAGLVDQTLDSIMIFDAQYTFSLEGLVSESSNTQVTVGCINCFDRLADPTLTLGGLETFLHDPRGRLWYGRLTQTF